MGRDKALPELDHQTFIGRLARELSICDEVFVCAPLGKVYADYGPKLISEGNCHMTDLLSSLRTNYVDISAGGFSKETPDNINPPADYARIAR